MLRNYGSSDEPALLNLWNTAGACMGYAPLTQENFHRLITGHPDFSPAYAFLLEEEGQLRGFTLGCAQGSRGYVACLLAETVEDTRCLLTALEASFRAAGCAESMVSFWCPIRMPWVIPGTPGHQHNNLPGVPLDLPLHGRLLDLGYTQVSREVAMYLDLSRFSTPGQVEEKAAKMAREGCTVAFYDPQKHRGLTEMTAALGNPQWNLEIPAAGTAGELLLVALKDDVVAGFAGPIRPEPTGRGYFAGIGVAPGYEKHGFGTLLFYRLCRAEREAGAQYMSLFTGAENRARLIYEGAGFRACRSFDVMQKKLGGTKNG